MRRFAMLRHMCCAVLLLPVLAMVAPEVCKVWGTLPVCEDCSCKEVEAFGAPGATVSVSGWRIYDPKTGTSVASAEAIDLIDVPGGCQKGKIGKTAVPKVSIWNYSYYDFKQTCDKKTFNTVEYTHSDTGTKVGMMSVYRKTCQ